MKGIKWSREELIITFNLYCKIQFGQIHTRNSKIIELAKLIDRTPSAVSWKLVNFASFDPELKKRGIKGAINSSKLDREIWDEFNENWGKLAFESEILLAKAKGETIEVSAELSSQDIEELKQIKGEEKYKLIKTRVNQSFFRKSILANYNSTCCITGIRMPEVLISSHIIPWSKDESIRLDPKNGLCLNALHDKAYDRGLITISPEYKIIVSESIIKICNEVEKDFFVKYNNCSIKLPEKFWPKKDFLEYHYEKIFVRG
jgi:putative restriction endonuclease